MIGLFRLLPKALLAAAPEPVVSHRGIGQAEPRRDEVARGSIVVENLGKRYRQRMPAGRVRRQASANGAPGNGRWSASGDFWALRDVSLRLDPGQCVGIVGNNGAGKSTLLRLIGGVGTPDAGRVRAVGRIGAILDLGTGLSDDLSGRENAYVAGVISGMTRAEVQRRLEDIIAFAELEEFIDSPLRTYSDGMRMRLAFAVAAHIEPDILLIDEALAVGDAGFQRKCLARLSEVKKSGCTTLIVSHDMSQLRALCDDLLYLDRGQAVTFGPTSEVLALYEGASEDPAADRGEGEPEDAAAPDANVGAGPAVAQVRLYSTHGRPTDTIASGTSLIVEADWRTGGQAATLHAHVGIGRSDGALCFSAGTDILDDAPGAGILRLTIARLDLVPGEYRMTVGLCTVQGEGAPGPVVEKRQTFRVVGPDAGAGLICPPVRWQVRRAT
jgi:lipopolysaccharide transport system ATP-binding protein